MTISAWHRRTINALWQRNAALLREGLNRTLAARGHLLRDRAYGIQLRVQSRAHILETLLGRFQSLTAARQIRPLGREIVRRGDESLPALVELFFGQFDLECFFSTSFTAVATPFSRLNIMRYSVFRSLSASRSSPAASGARFRNSSGRCRFL